MLLSYMNRCKTLIRCITLKHIVAHILYYNGPIRIYTDIYNCAIRYLAYNVSVGPFLYNSDPVSTAVIVQHSNSISRTRITCII